MDSKELTKLKDHKNFEPKKDGVLTGEFFKFLGNLSETDHAKLCTRHILNRSSPSQKLPHPKVVVKQPTTVVEDCYSVKKWIESKKKKATARFELHLIRPDLGLYTNINKQFVQTAWKNFKKDFHINKASMWVLLDWGPIDLYYTNQKQTQHGISLVKICHHIPSNSSPSSSTNEPDSNRRRARFTLAHSSQIC